MYPEVFGGERVKWWHLQSGLMSLETRSYLNMVVFWRPLGEIWQLFIYSEKQTCTRENVCKSIIAHILFNPSNAEVTFIQSTRMQRLLILNQLNPVMLVFSFQLFLHHFVLAKLATSSIKVNRNFTTYFCLCPLTKKVFPSRSDHMGHTLVESWEQKCDPIIHFPSSTCEEEREATAHCD